MKPSHAALALVLAVAAPARADDSDPPSWRRQAPDRLALRLSLTPAVAFEPSQHLSYVGGSVGVGYEAQFWVHPAINRWLFGQVFGAELRCHVLDLQTGEGSPWLVAPGLAYSAYVLFPNESPLHAWRFAAPFAVLVPEVGVAFRHREHAAPFLRFSAPAAVLIHQRVAVELTPALTILNPAPQAVPELLWELSLGVSWRQVVNRPPEPRGIDYISVPHEPEIFEPETLEP